MKVTWYYWAENREVGPLTLQQLELIASQQRIGPDTRVRFGLDGQWVAARTVAGLFPFPGQKPTTARRNPTAPPAVNDSGITRALPAPISANSGSGTGRNYLIIGVAACTMLAIVAVFATLSGEGEPRPPSPPIASTTTTSDSRLTVATSGDWRKSVPEKAKRGVVVVRSGNKQGSGFVVASSGRRNLIVTNKHVLVGHEFSSIDVDNYPKQYTMITESRHRFAGRLAVLAVPNSVDLAVLLVESSELEVMGPVARFDDISKGDEVVAVGTPFDEELFNSVNFGGVQAKIGGYFIATDASINPGNSGGPLIDKRGRIIGINDWKSKHKDLERFAAAIRADLLLDETNWIFVEDVSHLFREIRQ